MEPSKGPKTGDPYTDGRTAFLLRKFCPYEDKKDRALWYEGWKHEKDKAKG